MIALSTAWNAWRHLNGADIVSEIKSLGFEKIELSFNLRKETLAGIEAQVSRGLVGVTSLHNFCPIPDMLRAAEALPDYYSLSSLDEEEREIAVKYTKRTVEAAGRLNASAVVIHCGRVQMRDFTKGLADIFERGFASSPKYKREKEAMIGIRESKRGPHLERLKKSIGALVSYAEGFGVKIALENRYYYPEIPFIDEIDTLLKEFPNLFYWHDVGHAQNMENLGFAKHEDYLIRFGERLAGFHLHNIIKTRDHLPVQAGEFDFSKLKPYLKKDILLVIESHHPATAQEIMDGRVYLEELFGRI